MAELRALKLWRKKGKGVEEECDFHSFSPDFLLAVLGKFCGRASPLLFAKFFLSSRLDIVLAEVVSFASGAAVPPTPRHVLGAKDRSRRLAGRE